MKDFLSDESAQATTEYILMLFVAISFFMILYSKLLKPVFKNLGTTVGGYFDTFLSKGDLHRFPFKP